MGCCSTAQPEGTGKEATDGTRARNPLHARNNVCCTDIIVLVIFIAFWGLMAYIAVYSVVRGDGRRMLFGYDSFGNTCNQEYNAPIENLTHSGKNTKGKPYVFFMSMTDPLHSMQVCVSNCPDRDVSDIASAAKLFRETNISICSYDINPATDRSLVAANFSRKGPCADFTVYKSIKVVHRCVPDPRAILSHNDSRSAVMRKFFDIIELDDLFRKVLSDIYVCWRQMLALCGIAIVIAALMVVLIRFLAAIIVWLIVVLASVGSLVGTGVLWWAYATERAKTVQTETHIPVLGIDVQNVTAFLVVSIVATVLTVVLLLILLVLRKRIALVVALFHEAGKSLVDMPLLLIQPLWTFLILATFLAYWFIIQAHIATLGTPTPNYSKGFPSVKYVPERFATHFWWIHIVGLIWTVEFILACQQYVIASSVALWYFTTEKSRLGCPIVKAVCHLTLHHIGSVAFGSLIITLVKIPRYILMYLQSKCEASQNACAKCCLKCCICCLWCLEKLLKFINQNAYTIIAIDGSNFCSAAQKAFSILTSNVLRVAAINSVGAFVLFLGKVGVMAATCACAVVWLQTVPDLHYFAIPVVLISLFSFLIAHCFLSVYEMVVDALLLCFCEDCQMNDGSPGKEYYMNSTLMVFVKDSSSRIEQLNTSQAAARRKADQQSAAPGSTELQPMANRA